MTGFENWGIEPLQKATTSTKNSTSMLAVHLWILCAVYYPSLELTCSPLKMDGWEIRPSFWDGLFWGCKMLVLEWLAVLVGGFNSYEKIIVKMGSSSPIFGVNIKIFETTTQCSSCVISLGDTKNGEHKAETTIFVEPRSLGVRWPGDLRSLLGACWGLASILTLKLTFRGNLFGWLYWKISWREYTRSLWEDMMYSVTYPRYKKQLKRYPKCNTTSHHWI